MLGINAVIGAGIFLTPGAVIKLAGPLAPVAYILAGLFAGIMALVFATAARYVKTNGASYAYTTAAFGQRIGIYVGVTHAIVASIAWGVLASLFVATLLNVVFPQHNWAKDTELFSVKTLTFLIFIAVLLMINLFGNRAIEWANGISTVGKLSALSVFIIGGLGLHRRPACQQLRDGWFGRGFPTGAVRVVWLHRARAEHHVGIGSCHHGRAVCLHRFRIDCQRR